MFLPSTVEMWVASLTKAGLSYSSVMSHLSAIRFFCTSNSITPAFDTPKLKLMLKGVKRRTPVTVPKGVPTVSHLQRLAAAARRVLTTDACKTFIAMITMAFYGFLRPSEFCETSARHHLRVDSVSLNVSHSRLKLRFRSFKHSKGACKIYLDSVCDGSPCPVQAFRNYMNLLPASTSESLFPYTINQFRSMLQEVVETARIKTCISPHSFRHGGATWAAKQGWPDARIKAHGRWSSSAYHTYVRA